MYFPHGKYRLVNIQEGTNVKAHLLIPNTKEIDKRNRIMFRMCGEGSVVTPCLYASHTHEDELEVWENGSVLFSDYLGEIQTESSDIPTSIIAADGGENIYGLNIGRASCRARVSAIV